MPDERIAVISSDGHAGAEMADYRSYLDPQLREEFDDFLVEWDEVGSRAFDTRNLANRLDPVFVQEWETKMIATGRVDGYDDPTRRLAEVEKEGICAEVLFPDFGLPFELYPPTLASALGYPPLDEEHVRAGYRAFNRWLADYVSCAPERFAGMAIVSWADADAAVEELRAARASGLRGVVLPKFPVDRPLYHEDYAPIWRAIASLGMVVNSHGGMSATSDVPAFAPGAPHPACTFRLVLPEHIFYCRNVLSHLIWGGVAGAVSRYPLRLHRAGLGLDSERTA